MWPARVFVLGPQLARAAVCGLDVGFGCSRRDVALQAPRSINGPVDARLGLRGPLAQFFHAALTFEFEAQLKGVAAPIRTTEQRVIHAARQGHAVVRANAAPDGKVPGHSV